MLSLADTQHRMRDAVIAGDATRVAGLLLGGRDPRKRLEIHRRHYESSLVTALLDKFPATAWLVGTPFLTEAARAFVRERPPHAPCIAEYGAEFPEFLETCPGAERVPYLCAFNRLEWNVGLVSIAIDRPAGDSNMFGNADGACLPDLVLTLQAGLRLLHTGWPVDDLMKLYLTDTAPNELAIEPIDVWIQVRGARGTLHIDRLDRADFAFRQAIVDGHTIGEAAERALDVSDTFDPGEGLRSLITEGLVTGATVKSDGDLA